MRTSKIMLTLLLAVLFVIVPVVRGEVIYFDNFDGQAGADLNGTRPDITPGGETWVAGQYIDADGTLSTGSANNMFTAALPFVPVNGMIYELSAKVDNQGDWVGIGFLSAVTNLETRILDNSPLLWALARQSGTGAKDQAFVGPGTAGALGDAPTSSAEELKVRVDTRNETQWVVTWYFDGIQTFQRSMNPMTNIQYCAFGSNGLFSGVSGKISSFLLEEISQNTKAYNPGPADKSTDIPVEATLSWSAGIFAAQHDIFISSDLDALNSATNADPMGPDQIYLARQELDANSIVVAGLIPETAYYWRVDEINQDNAAGIWPGDVWSFTTVPYAAIGPDPVDGAIFVEPEAVLSWTPGPYAVTHDVYVGTNFDDVNDATREAHPGITYYSENQEAGTYPADGTLSLELGQTYYWRVDGVNDSEIYKGRVWSFKVMEFGGGAVIGDWELNLDGWRPWSGTTSYSDSVGVTLGNYSLKHVIPAGTGYVSVIELTDVSGGVEAFLANNTFSVDLTRLAADWPAGDTSNIYMYVDADGDGFHNYGISANSTWSPDEGNKTMTLTWNYSDSLELIPVEPTFLRIIIWQEVTGATGDDVVYYLDNARLGTPLAASQPNPSNSQTDVKRSPTLRWTAGKLAKTHDVYFGTDENAVRNATQASSEYRTTLDLDSEKYQPGVLEFLSTYYWRVDEIDEENIFKGTVWNFTVGNYISIDDFEDYNDYPPDEVWNTWIDGYSDPLNGSTAGYPDPDFNAGEHYLETTIVHSGNQSLPLFYDNAVGISDVTRTLTSTTRDWTQEGVDNLRMWYYGDAANAPEPMYVAVNGVAVVTNDDANAALVTEWTQWDIPLQTFADMGVNLSTVNSISLGFGNKTNPSPGGGSGHVFFDDIRLTRP